MTRKFRIFRTAMLAAAVAVSFTACKKDEGGSLNGLPTVDFEAIPGSNPNVITLVNKSSTSMPVWRVGNSANLLRGDSAKTSFDNKGTYNVTLFAIGQGGLDSITKQIVIAQDDVTACQRNVKGFIAGCGTTGKKWKLNPAAGAYKVGDGGPTAGNWWTSPAGEPAARPCEFNDEYTFTYATGAFVYDNKGDFFGDNYLGNNTGTCQPSSNYTPTQAPWGSGTFTFSFVEGGGYAGLGQLTVTGLGAHIGLQKVRNGAEVTSGPATAITYDVLAKSHVDGTPGYDLLTVGTNIGGNGWWAFTLRSF